MAPSIVPREDRDKTTPAPKSAKRKNDEESDSASETPQSAPKILRPLIPCKRRFSFTKALYVPKRMRLDGEVESKQPDVPLVEPTTPVQAPVEPALSASQLTTPKPPSEATLASSAKQTASMATATKTIRKARRLSLVFQRDALLQAQESDALVEQSQSGLGSVFDDSANLRITQRQANNLRPRAPRRYVNEPSSPKKTPRSTRTRSKTAPAQADVHVQAASIVVEKPAKTPRRRSSRATTAKTPKTPAPKRASRAARSPAVVEIAPLAEALPCLIAEKIIEAGPNHVIIRYRVVK